LVKGTLKTMAWTKLKIAVACAAVVVIGAGSATVAAKAAAATPPPTAAAPQVRYELEVGQVREGVNGTSVSVTARFYNDSDKELSIPVWGRAEIADVFRFEIIGPDGKALVAPQQGRLTAPIPAQVTRDLVTAGPGGRPIIRTTPFVPVAAKGMVQFAFTLGTLGGGAPTGPLSWCFPRPGTYQLKGEYVSTYSTYVDPNTHAIQKAQSPFLGSVRAPTVQFKVSRSAAEGGFENYFIRSLPGARGVTLPVIGGNPGGRGGLTISGSTLTDQGKPLAGTIVEITANKYSGRGGPGNAGDEGYGILRKLIDRLRSGTDGMFTFEDLPPDADSYTIRAVPEGNYVPAVLALSNEKTNRIGVRITLQNGIALRGRVLDKDGRGLADVRVTGYGQTESSEPPSLQITGATSVRAAWGTVYTRESGEFEMQGLGDAMCSLQIRGFKPMPNARPAPGHENDGTWTIVMEPAN
jgi:hypothetical protein